MRITICWRPWDRSVNAGSSLSKCLSYLRVNSCLVQAKCLLFLLKFFFDSKQHVEECVILFIEIFLQLEHIIQAWSKALYNLILVLSEGVRLKRKPGKSLSEQDIRVTLSVSKVVGRILK